MSRVGTIAVTQIFTSVKNWVNSKLPTKISDLTNDSNFLTTSSSLDASKLTGTIDIARLPQGALERVITVADQTARFALTTSSVQLGDTVKQLDTGVMYVVVNESKLNSNDGYLEYTAGSASSVPWSGITSKPTEFTPSSHTHTKSEITDFPTNVSAFTNDSGYLTSHQSLSNYVTLNTAQEITSAKTFKDTTTARKLTSVEAGNVIPSSDKLISDIWQDKNGKELGRIYYSKTKNGNTALILRAGDWFSESEGVYSLNASGTNRRAELQLYTDSSGNCCIKPNGLFSTHIKPLDSSVYLGDSTKPFGRVYANSFQFCNAGLLPDTDVQTTEEHSVGFFGKNNGPLSYITFQKRPNLKDRIAVRVQTTSSSYKSYDFDATCFYPESSNSVDIGSTTNIFKNIYCNNYYKGTTAFGDIVTHNASEFLTSHQSLANYVTTNTSQSISGIKTFPTNINLANTSTSQREYWALKFSKTDTNGTGASQLGVFQPSNSNDFVACLRLGNPRGDNKPTTGTGVNTGNCWSGIGVYYNYALNRGYPYAPSCNSWSDSSNADAELASTSWVRRYCETTKGFLTSHQSLGSCVKNNVPNSQTIKSTAITRGTAPSSTQTFGIVFTDNNGASIGNIYGQYATDKSTYVGLYAYKGTTTSNSDNTCIRVGYDASGNAYTYAPTPATTDNSTQIATTAFVKAQGYLTSHQSLANYVTTNTDQSISGTKTFGNGTLIVDNGIGNNVHGEIKLNGSRPGYIVADNASDGVFDNAGCGISILLQDAGKPLHIGAYKTDSNGRVFVDNTNKNPVLSITSGLIRTSTLVPENDTGNSSFRIVSQIDYANGDTSKVLDVRFTQFDDGSSSVYPVSNNKTDLGLNGSRWKGVYATNFYENGTALSDKYLTVSAISGGASTSAGNITPVKGTIISGFAESDQVTYSTNFGGVLTAPSGLYYATCVYNTSNSTMEYSKGPSVGGTGTWKLMGGCVQNPGSNAKLLFGLWIKIV